MVGWVRIVNNFLHDLATGFWLALVLVTAGNRRVLAGAGLLAQARPVLQLAFWWTAAALAVILVTGGLRTLSYRDQDERDRALKRRLLWVKHVLLGAAFALGTVYAYRLAFA